MSFFVLLIAWPSARTLICKSFWLDPDYSIGMYTDFNNIVDSAEEIGETVQHSRKTFFLTCYSGLPLKYHGELSGTKWPQKGDLQAYKKLGRPEMTIEQRFSKMCSNFTPEYFIITEFGEFAKQPGLQEYLVSKYPVLAKTDKYLIYDLRDR